MFSGCINVGNNHFLGLYLMLENTNFLWLYQGIKTARTSFFSSVKTFDKVNETWMHGKELFFVYKTMTVRQNFRWSGNRSI